MCDWECGVKQKSLNIMIAGYIIMDGYIMYDHLWIVLDIGGSYHPEIVGYIMLWISVWDYNFP